MMLEDYVLDTRARDFFAEYVLDDGSAIPDELQDEYTRNASVINLLLDMKNKARVLRKALNNPAGDLWSTIYGTADRLRVNPGHTLPKSRARLRDKINEYNRNGYACLVSGKLGNRNTVKITEEGGTFIVMKKRCRLPILSDEDIFNEYNRVAPHYGWKELQSVASVTNYLKAPENEQRWYDAVYGELKAHQKFGYKFKTNLPERRDSLWYGDGTKLNLYYKAYEGGKLVMRTTQVYEVMDAYSEVFLGYHISDTENYESQYNAYRMAVETAQNRPYEIVVDNQGGHAKLDNSGFLKRICRVQRNTTPYRGQAKSIEAVFGRFQKQYLNKNWRFTGQNVTAKSQKSRINLEFIEANKEKLYTWEELQRAYAIAREAWNNAPHPATGVPRMEMYKNSYNAQTDKLDKLDMIEMFWMMTVKPSTFTASGIKVTINKEKYTYDVYCDGLPDFDFRRKNIGRKFYVQYDPLDLTQVRLYVKDATGLRYVTDAMPYVVVQRALQDATTESSSFIRSVQDFETELRVANYLENVALEHEYGIAPEQHGLRRPAIKGVSKKRFEKMANAHTERATRRNEPISVGEHEKALSNLTEAEMYDRMMGL